jgi:hypothetical protein
MHFRASPILLFPLYCANTIGAVIFTLLMGEVRRRKKKIYEIPLLALQICPALLKLTASAFRFAYRRRV